MKYKCKCCCGIEFDTIGLYPNFQDGWTPTIKYLLDSFLHKYDIDLRLVEVGFCYPDYLTLQKYGQHHNLENIKWLNTLSNNRVNFFRDFRSEKDNYIDLFNYINNTKSIALFIGTLNPTLENEFTEIVKADKIPVIHLTPDFYVHVNWVGIPDREYNFYLDNLS